MINNVEGPCDGQRQQSYKWSHKDPLERSRLTPAFQRVAHFIMFLLLLFKITVSACLLSTTLAADVSWAFKLLPNFYLFSLFCKAWQIKMVGGVSLAVLNMAQGWSWEACSLLALTLLSCGLQDQKRTAQAQQKKKQ